LASAWPRSLTEPSIGRRAELRKRPRRVKSQAKPAVCGQPARQPGVVAFNRSGPGRPGPRATVRPHDAGRLPPRGRHSRAAAGGAHLRRRPLAPFRRSDPDHLTQRQAPATFFVVGRQVQRYPELVRRELAAGMALGSHSWSHSQPFDRLPVARIRDEIARGRRSPQALGVRPVGFRPPGGPPPRPWRRPAKRSATAPCCGASTRPTGGPASPPTSWFSGCWPGSGRARLCCCTMVAVIGRPRWRPCRPSSMGCAAWASPHRRAQLILAHWLGCDLVPGVRPVQYRCKRQIQQTEVNHDHRNAGR
jgi:Polysaccharide deacetylase